MGSIGGGELPNMDRMQVSAPREERILVLVRLRPLSEKEIVANEVADWECINETTILYRNTLREGSTFPSAYSFDRVFRGDCSTRQVYDDGVKEVAMSVVSGINCSIFAYGQTCSGKTYTMMGITEYTVADIFDYIHKHEERAYVLKFSAIEIYNEAIRDLLSTDSTPLRLLDDPEKGTIVEKATEETLKNWNHLQELLSVCEAQRRIGETSLNEKSSRSHQILRLTIESSAREFLGRENSTTLAATVNFVDLAGSERASQSLSSGTRLKEGCHINRSLLTLGTVIRKLSKGRHGHINYRDSKLTRLLQPALGGNARTAIICTLSPARSHVEQTRNTLLFACCAKEVTTKAQVNVVMSDKALVKHLQKELARLESELSRPAPASTSDYAALLRKKDLQIQKMEKEIRELTKQRDLAESRIADLLKMIGNDQTSRNGIGSPDHSQQRGDAWESESSASEASGVAFHPYMGKDVRRSNMSMYDEDSGSNIGEPYYLEDNMEGHSLSNTSSPILMGKKITESAEDVDDYCKEVQCIEMDESRRESYFEPISLANGEIDTSQNGFTYNMLEQRLNHAQSTFDALVTPEPNETSPGSSMDDVPNSRIANLSKSSGSKEQFMEGSSPDFEREEEFESTPPNNLEKTFGGRPKSMRRKFPPLDYGVDSTARLTRSDSQSSLGNAYTDDLGSPSIKTSTEEDNIPTVQTFVEGLKEMAMQATDSAAGVEKNSKDVGLDPMETWPAVFERQMKEIIELWQACNVSVVHRTYFYLLFKGDSSDSIYMEVELRRLHFLKEKLSQGSRSGGGERTITFSSSMKALKRERGMLTRLMQKRLSEEERKAIYERWGIGWRSKRRRVQLANRLWSNTEDMSHITESAAIVAKLVRFVEQGEALKEMFGLSFTPPSSSRRRSLGWSHVNLSI